MRRWACLSLTLVVLAACNSKPAFLEYAEKLAALQQIDDAFDKSLDAEKNAVLATTDHESEAFAAESRAASAEVTRGIVILRELIMSDPVQKEVVDLAKLEETWNELKAVDERLLKLAIANTNLKALALSTGDGRAALNRAVDALAAIAARDTDVEDLRGMMNASISALRVQTLLSTHIASAKDAEMTQIEEQIDALKANVNGVMQTLVQNTAAEERADAEAAIAAWVEYQRLLAEVIRLSRENTNVRSFDISITEKRRAAEAFRVAIAALATDVRSSLPATR